MYYSNPFYNELAMASAEMTHEMQHRSDLRDLSRDADAGSRDDGAVEEQVAERGDWIRQEYLVRASRYASLV